MVNHPNRGRVWPMDSEYRAAMAILDHRQNDLADGEDAALNVLCGAWAANESITGGEYSRAMAIVRRLQTKER